MEVAHGQLEAMAHRGTGRGADPAVRREAPAGRGALARPLDAHPEDRDQGNAPTTTSQSKAEAQHGGSRCSGPGSWSRRTGRQRRSQPTPAPTRSSASATTNAGATIARVRRRKREHAVPARRRRLDDAASSTSGSCAAGCSRRRSAWWSARSSVSSSPTASSTSYRAVLRLPRSHKTPRRAVRSGPAPLDTFMLHLKVALYVGLLVGRADLAVPAVGVHRAGAAPPRAPLHVRLRGDRRPAVRRRRLLAYLIVSQEPALLPQQPASTASTRISGYFDFVTKMMLLFGAGFEFPLLMVMLNIAGLASGKQLLGWWRMAIFLMFVVRCRRHARRPTRSA